MKLNRTIKAFRVPRLVRTCLEWLAFGSSLPFWIPYTVIYVAWSILYVVYWRCRLEFPRRRVDGFRGR